MRSYRAVRRAFTLWWALCLSPVFGQSWTRTNAPERNWTSIHCSADGTMLVGAAYGGGIYVSTNSGVTWNETPEPQEGWSAVASSADGGRIIAASALHIYVSTNSGLNWTLTSAVGNWTALACSADGMTVVATEYVSGWLPDGKLFTSHDGGMTWTQNTPEDYFFRSAACSADGNRLLATASYITRFGRSGATYGSLNAGETWFNRGGDGMSISCSADGSKLFLAQFGIGVVVSTNSGTTWADPRTPPDWWSSVACSADGARVVAATGGWSYNYAGTGSVYTSWDSGSTWTSNSAPVAVWQALACSADGCKLAAAAFGGGIYTQQQTPVPVLSFTQSADGLLLSWITPSVAFGLEESTDLKDWSGVSITPALNYTNLHQEIILRSPTGLRFYRLASTVR